MLATGMVLLPRYVIHSLASWVVSRSTNIPLAWSIHDSAVDLNLLFITRHYWRIDYLPAYDRVDQLGSAEKFLGCWTRMTLTSIEYLAG